MSVILKMLAASKSIQEVLEAYPELEAEDVQAGHQICSLGGFVDQINLVSKLNRYYDSESPPGRYEYFHQRPWRFLGTTGMGYSSDFTIFASGCIRSRNSEICSSGR